MASGEGKPGWLSALDAPSLTSWDGEWQRLARLICCLPDISDEHRIGVLALGDRLVEHYIRDMANAIADFPGAILRAWRVDDIEVAAAFRQKSGTNPIDIANMPRVLREIKVEIAMECITSVRSSVCQLSVERIDSSLEGEVRRIIFLTIVEYLRRLLQGSEINRGDLS